MTKNISITNSKLDTTCAVLEVLMRETQKIVLPAYYETGLKVKWSKASSPLKIDLIQHVRGCCSYECYSSRQRPQSKKDAEASFFDIYCLLFKLLLIFNI